MQLCPAVLAGGIQQLLLQWLSFFFFLLAMALETLACRLSQSPNVTDNANLSTAQHSSTVSMVSVLLRRGRQLRQVILLLGATAR